MGCQTTVCNAMYYSVTQVIDNNWRGRWICDMPGVIYTNLVANDDEEEKGNCRIDMPRFRNKKLQIKIPRLFI